MRKGILYLAFNEDDQNDLAKIKYDNAIKAQIFAETNNIDLVFEISDCSNLFWKARKGIKQILSELENHPVKIECIVVNSYENLIYEQRDFNDLKRMLEGLQIELISISRGIIEVECDYYYEP